MNRSDLKLQGIYLDPAVAVKVRHLAVSKGTSVTEIYNRILHRAINMPELHEPVEGLPFGRDENSPRKRARKGPEAVETRQPILPEYEQAEVLRLNRRGYTASAIAALTKLSYSKVHSILTEARKAGAA